MNHIPKSAPADLLTAYGRVLDLADAISAVRVAAQSHSHTLQLPDAAVAKLIEAHQALLAAHRSIEAELRD